MSDMENPYASPQTEIVPVNELRNQGALTDTMLGYLKEAAPWLRFLGIVCYISCGLMAFSGIAAIIGMGALSSLWESIPELDSLGSIFNTVFSFSMGSNFLLVAVLFFFPARFIHNFGVKLRSYFQNGKEQELELALKNNKSLWKFLGILMIINLAMIPVIIVLAIIFALVVAFI